MVDFRTLLESQECRWPQDGDLLLRPVSSSSDGARFADHSLTRHTCIWDGYIKAANILAYDCTHDSSDNQELVYPILFNYRHGLEVAMKWILDNYGRFAGIQEYKKDHNLIELWKLCVLTITRVCDLDEHNVLQSVGNIVQEFHKIDESSFSFRYPTSKNGKTVQLPSISIDLENLRMVMKGLNNFFVTIDVGLENITSAIPTA
jgi:hypothetical protein